MALSPEVEAQIAALVTAQAAARRTNEAAATAAASAALRGFSGWYSTEAIRKWATDMARLVESHQRLTARTTNAYLARVVRVLTGKRTGTAPLVDPAGIRTGVTHPGVYGRVADTWRYQTSRLDQQVAYDGPELAQDVIDGTTETDRPAGLVSADTAAQRKLTQLVEQDIALAARDQAREFMQAERADEIRGYRRVIHPEMAKGGTCGLCFAASDRIYKVSELMPLHTGCHCTVLPIIRSLDPGSGINGSDLKLLYGLAGSTGRADLSKVRYQVDSNGELGPVLGAAKQRTVPAQDAKARKSPTRRGRQAVVGDFATSI